MKLSDVTNAVVDQLKTTCGQCSSDMIDNQFFVCYSECPSFVTYRARLEGTRETDSDSLISLIEEWVRGGVIVIVTGDLMTVDPHCSVAISSPDQPECSLPPTVKSNSTIKEAEPVSDNTPAIIGGALGVLFITVITIALALVIFIFLKYCPKGNVSLKKSGEKYVSMFQ